MIQVNKKKHSGLTLIELMVAVTIGLIIMAGVMQIYLSNKQTYRTTEALSRLQENGRFTSHFLVKDIRKAGYIGCRKRFGEGAIDVLSFPAPPSYFDTSGGIKGNNNSDGGEDLDGDGTDDITNVLVGTDVIHLQYGGSCGGLVVKSQGATLSINCPNECGLTTGDFFLISDCKTAGIATITSNVNCAASKEQLTHGGNVNIVPPQFKDDYVPPAEIFTLESVSYYIALNGNGNPSLMRRNNKTAATEELVEDVDDLQFDYGEDTDGSGVANYYVSAASIVNMEDIVSVRMSARVRTSDDNISQSANTVIYNGGNVTDKRIRHTFSTTIAIRNR